ncbi:hypothetical protein AL714_16285 [Clostridium botulinum]|nr:hypothetical protein [Clostridium botulinum]MCC5439805.1 hypothetical protein [Clostridium botulinum]NFR57597.1 hypothetical protein [Clostridium botulinum]OPD35913.1 hypothetical protein AL714_16285 [Clostridium botulinum]
MKILYKLYLVEYEPWQPPKLFRQDEMSFEHFKIHHPVACFMEAYDNYGFDTCIKTYGIIRNIIHKEMTQEEYEKLDTITEMASYTYSSRS